MLIAAMVAREEYKKSAVSESGLQATIDKIAGAKLEVQAFVDATKGQSVTAMDEGERQSKQAIERRLADATSELKTLKGAAPGNFDMILEPQATIVSEFGRQIKIELLEQEIGFLQRLNRNLDRRDSVISSLKTVDEIIKSTNAKIVDLQTVESGYREKLKNLEDGPMWERYLPDGTDLVAYTNSKLVANLTEQIRLDTQIKILEDSRRKIRDASEKIRQFTEQASPRIAIDNIYDLLLPMQNEITSINQKLDEIITRQAMHWYERFGISKKLVPALAVVIGVILTPFAIRALFYWVIAPLASLQRPIRLLEAGVPIVPPVERSSVSKGVTLGQGEELLVKQGFLQTTSHDGDKSTRLLLDFSHPLSSLASGLAFLTRIRGGSEDSTTVSATRDPFAEISVLNLPAGAACVLQPRALVGVIQPVDQPMKISSHWRLGTLNAWLTFQLRFLIFHGPAKLILKGGRGVRIEPVVAGRSIGQDQLIGFSTGVAYSTGRTETFLPYFFGQESLLKDRIAEGAGVLIAEEAPMASRRRKGVAHGLEGALDATLKVFGI
jgi:hypothetical protein